VPEEREDSVTHILEGRGIKYSHRNDDILVPNSIEEQQMKKARKVRVLLDQTRSPHCLFKIQERRQREKKAMERDANSEPEFEWPPKRQHHTRPPSPRTKYVLNHDPNTVLFHRAKSRLQTPPASDCAGRTQNDSDAGRPAFICSEFVWAVPLFLSLWAHTDGPILSVKKTPEEQNELLAKLDAHGTPATR
jgi:hypothetical protein